MTVTVELPATEVQRLLQADTVCSILAEHGGIVQPNGKPALSLAFAREAQEALEAWTQLQEVEA